MVSNYKLEEITSVQELRGNVSKLFKLNSELKHPGVRAASLSMTMTAELLWHGVSQLQNRVPCCLLGCLTLGLLVPQAIDVVVYKGREELEVRDCSP